MRARPGIQNGNAKLNELEVRYIRIAHRKGDTFAGLSRQFGVSWQTIRNVVLGRTWKHLAEEP